MPSSNQQSGSLGNLEPRRDGSTGGDPEPPRPPRKRRRRSSGPYSPNDPRLDLFRPGPYARDEGRLPTNTTDQNFSDETKEKITEFGNKYGCHSCGSKAPGWASGLFTPDHQKVSNQRRPHEQSEQQYLYPQCAGCSRQQGGMVTGLNKKGQNAYDLLDQRDREA